MKNKRMTNIVVEIRVMGSVVSTFHPDTLKSAKDLYYRIGQKNGQCPVLVLDGHVCTIAEAERILGSNGKMTSLPIL